MNTPTFKEQFNKITEAYIKGEIKPFDSKFCFCGTLCDNTNKWFWMERREHKKSNGYLGVDFVRMEKALIETILRETGEDRESGGSTIMENINYENALFNGMCAALEVLKDIHKSRGENVEEEFEFKKRQLAI